MGRFDAGHPVPKFPPSVGRGCLRPSIRHGVISQSRVDVWDEDGEKPMEKKSITRKSSRCVGVRMSVPWEPGRIRNAPVKTVPGVDGTRYRKSWSFAPYVAPESQTDNLYNANWMIRASSGSNRDFNADYGPIVNALVFVK